MCLICGTILVLLALLALASWWRRQQGCSGLSPLGVPGMPKHPQTLADQLTLSQPGGRLFPASLLEPSDFQTFLRPCYCTKLGYYYGSFMHFVDFSVHSCAFKDLLTTAGKRARKDLICVWIL